MPRNRALTRQRPAAGGRHETVAPTATRIRRWNSQPVSVSKRSISSSIRPPEVAGEIAHEIETLVPGATSFELVPEMSTLVEVKLRRRKVSR